MSYFGNRQTDIGYDELEEELFRWEKKKNGTWWNVVKHLDAEKISAFFFSFSSTFSSSFSEGIWLHWMACDRLAAGAQLISNIPLFILLI